MLVESGGRAVDQLAVRRGSGLRAAMQTRQQLFVPAQQRVVRGLQGRCEVGVLGREAQLPGEGGTLPVMIGREVAELQQQRVVSSALDVLVRRLHTTPRHTDYSSILGRLLRARCQRLPIHVPAGQRASAGRGGADGEMRRRGTLLKPCAPHIFGRVFDPRVSGRG